MSVSLNRHKGNKKDLYCVGVDDNAHCKGMSEKVARELAGRLSGDKDYIDNTDALCIITGRVITHPNRPVLSKMPKLETVSEIPAEVKVDIKEEPVKEKKKKEKSKKKEA